MTRGSNAGCELEIAEESLRLLPERAVWWPRRESLILADTHFGKAAVFRQSGIPVPAGTTASILERLSRLLHELSPKRLCILGDLVHSSVRTELDFASELIMWRTSHSAIDIVLVRGNHDRGQDRLWDELRLQVVEEPFPDGPFDLCHKPPDTGSHCADASDPGSAAEVSRFVLAGHLHPCVRLSSAAGDSLRLPCFHVRGTSLILPAFGDFTGMHSVRRVRNDQVYVVGEDRVFPLSSAGVAGRSRRQVMNG